MRIYPFLVPLLVGGIIQGIKVLVDVFARKEKLNFKSFWTSGGFPSVHSGIASSITTLVVLMYGFNSIYFAICLTFAFLFRYDATNIRFQAGKHAQYINEIKDELKSFSFIDYKLQDLQERLGHTFVEVIGGIVVGIVMTIIIYKILAPLLGITFG